MLLTALPDEFVGVDLPDSRLKERLKRIAQRISEFPKDGFPVAFERGDELLGLYRFTANERVDATKLFLAHISATAARCAGPERVVVVHDTTEFAFSTKREGCYRLSGDRYGFLGHFSIALRGLETRRPMGTLAYSTVKRVEQRPAGRRWEDVFNDPNKESLRWLRGCKAAEEHLGGRAPTVHVMDREGDSWELFEALCSEGLSFVIRMTHDRVLSSGGHVKEALGSAPVLLSRNVQLSARQDTGQGPKQKKRHPTRLERAAQLEIAAVQLSLRRPAHIEQGPEALPLNVVHVREVDAPEGVEPVEWRLVTNLPIDSAQQVAEAVDIYRARWLIEEFFKSLKTGCSFLKRQAESLEVLERILALYTAAAWRLLLLRWISRNEPDAPATTVVTPVQLQILQQTARRTKFSRNPTAGEATLALAELGGHLPQNGPPGWLVLGRGFERLTEREIGWMMAIWTLNKKAAPDSTPDEGVEM